MLAISVIYLLIPSSTVSGEGWPHVEAGMRRKCWKHKSALSKQTCRKWDVATACTRPRDGRLQGTTPPHHFGIAESLFLLLTYVLGEYMKDYDAPRTPLTRSLAVFQTHPILVLLYTSISVCQVANRGRNCAAENRGGGQVSC